MVDKHNEHGKGTPENHVGTIRLEVFLVIATGHLLKQSPTTYAAFEIIFASLSLHLLVIEYPNAYTNNSQRQEK